MARIGFWQSEKNASLATKGISAGTAGASRDLVGRHKPPPGDRFSSETSLLVSAFEELGHGWFWATDRDGCLTYLTHRIVPLLSNVDGPLIGTPFASIFLKRPG
jgi:hypothetical protein